MIISWAYWKMSDQITLVRAADWGGFIVPPTKGARTMFDEAETLATTLSEDSETLLTAIEDQDKDEAKRILNKIEGTAKDLRSELNSIPTTADVGEPEGE